MGELHLDIKVDILRRTYKVDANIGQPQVAYREKLTRRQEIDYTHKKQTGGTGQFARVKLVLEPNETGKGNEFDAKIVGGLAVMETRHIGGGLQIRAEVEHVDQHLRMALRLQGRDPGASVRDWERGHTPISGPVSIA